MRDTATLPTHRLKKLFPLIFFGLTSLKLLCWFFKKGSKTTADIDRKNHVHCRASSKKNQSGCWELQVFPWIDAASTLDIA